MELEEVKSNTVLFRQGDEGETYYLVFSGEVGMYLEQEHSQQKAGVVMGECMQVAIAAAVPPGLILSAGEHRHGLARIAWHSWGVKWGACCKMPPRARVRASKRRRLCRLHEWGRVLASSLCLTVPEGSSPR